MSEEKSTPSCVLCDKPDTEVPLIQLSYNNKAYYLCAEHMPMLIHKPAALVGKLPGAENMSAG